MVVVVVVCLFSVSHISCSHEVAGYHIQLDDIAILAVSYQRKGEGREEEGEGGRGDDREARMNSEGGHV